MARESSRQFVPGRPALARSLALALTLALAGCGSPGATSPVVTQAGDLTLAASLRPDPPRQKGNSLLLTVRDAEGRPVADAQVTVEYEMPAMGDMPAMKGRAEIAPQAGGTYRAAFDLPMSGTWSLAANVASGAGSASAAYRLTVGNAGLTVTGSSAGGGRPATSGSSTKLQPPRAEFSQPALASLRASLAAYQEARGLLAQGRLTGVDGPARRMAGALHDVASEGAELPVQVRQIAEEGAASAEALASAGDLEPARAAFGEVSRALLLLANCDPRVGAGWHVFTCPMTTTFDKWLQPGEDLENPYMGPAMVTCGAPSDWAVEAPATAAEALAHADAAHGGEVAYYTCSMHPSVHLKAPGTCPICSMNLVPVTRQELESGTITVSAERRQWIGVRTAPVERRPVSVRIRAVGKVKFDETRLADVTLKYRGWVGRLFVDQSGQRVSRGQTLLTLYSPDLFTAEQEFLAVLDSQRAARDSAAPDRADYLVAAARQRLKLWDITDREIDRIAATGEAVEYLPIVSPASGVVVEKNVVAGATVEPGMRLYRIAGLDRVWIEAEVYESELPLVAVGQEAKVTLPYLPGRSFPGKVSFVYPYLDDASRTGRVRVALANRDLELKPDMFANVELVADRGECLVVPESAVVYSGPRRLVFLDLGEGRLRPQEIEVGVKSGDGYEVLSGLREGDVIVTSGNFLIAAESRLKSAAGAWQ